MEPLHNLKAIRATSHEGKEINTSFTLMMKGFADKKGLKWMTEKDCSRLGNNIRQFSEDLNLED